MTPERETKVNGRHVEEYYWAGRLVVYVDGHRFNGSYQEAVVRIKNGGYSVG